MSKLLMKRKFTFFSRYELSLSVSDKVWQQSKVPANVTVLVKELDPGALNHAVPLTLYPTTAAQLTAHWKPSVSYGSHCWGRCISNISVPAYSIL